MLRHIEPIWKRMPCDVGPWYQLRFAVALSCQDSRGACCSVLLHLLVGKAFLFSNVPPIKSCLLALFFLVRVLSQAFFFKRFNYFAACLWNFCFVTLFWGVQWIILALHHSQRWSLKIAFPFLSTNISADIDQVCER
jgi:hypothetical protein